MKTRRFLSLLLALCMLLGAAAGAFAAEPADEITYPEAVELMDRLGVLAPLGGSGLGGKASAPITWNEAFEFVKGFKQLNGDLNISESYDTSLSYDNNAAFGNPEAAITGEEFLSSFVFPLLQLKDRFGFDMVKYAKPEVATGCHLLSGFGLRYSDFADKRLTREDAAQIMLNALPQNIGNNSWTLQNCCGVWSETFSSSEDTDLFCRPLRQWHPDGSDEAITQKYVMSPVYSGEATIGTHDLLSELGIYDYPTSGHTNLPGREGWGYASGVIWANFNTYENGQEWGDPYLLKCHWQDEANSCFQDYTWYRLGSGIEVYYMGTDRIDGVCNGKPFHNYRVILTSDYLAYADNKWVSIYGGLNDDGTPVIWGGQGAWHEDAFPSETGYYVINISWKAGSDSAKAVCLQPANVIRSSLNGMIIAPVGQESFVFYDGAKNIGESGAAYAQLSPRCFFGRNIAAQNGDEYYHTRKRIGFLHDRFGNVLGMLDGASVCPVGNHTHNWRFDLVYQDDDQPYRDESGNLTARTELLSNSVHEKWCTVCGAWSEEAHNYSRGSYQPSTASRDGSVACADCGYVQTIERHSHFSDADKWLYDQDAHFHLCQFPLCRERVDAQAHSFENGVCTVCLLKEGSLETSTHIHAPAAAYEAELSGHTLPCFYPDCGFVFDKGAHTLDSHGVCTVCGFNRDLASHLPLVYAGFADVPENAWYAWAVSNVTERGLMQGLSEERFAPEGNCTRAMIWTVLARMNGEAITGSQWAERARAWAVSFGVSDGENADGLITREQLVTMLYRAAGEPKASFQLDGYRDSALISAYARPAMAWALETGILSSAAEVLRPADSATRAEVAAILSRY